MHCSGALVLEELRPLKERKGSPIYLETCPHYLTHASDDPLGTLGKINPPLRAHTDIEALWAALASGLVDTVGSDHVARKRAKKTGSIWTSSAGFPSSPLVLPVLLSEGFHRRGLQLTRVAQVTSMNPARIFGLYPRKGTIAVGSDADFTLVDIDKEQVATSDLFQSHADYTLVDGWRMKGWPVATVVCGNIVMRDGRVVAPPGGRRCIQGG